MIKMVYEASLYKCFKNWLPLGGEFKFTSVILWTETTNTQCLYVMKTIIKFYQL